MSKPDWILMSDCIRAMKNAIEALEWCANSSDSIGVRKAAYEAVAELSAAIRQAEGN